MATPTKAEIVAKAQELYAKDCYRKGCAELAGTIPEIAELAEDGYLRTAKSELMRGVPSRYELAQWQSFCDATEETPEEMQQFHDKLKTLVRDVSDFGDLLLISNKGYGKTNSLMVLAEKFRELPDTRVIIFEDFPKFCNSFSSVPYFIVHDDDVTESSHTVDMENYFLRHERDYTVKRGSEIQEYLESNKDAVFTMELSDIERAAFFVYSVVQHFYRKAYLRAYKDTKKQERIIFIIEESQNVFDSSTISKKLFNRLRKIFSVARNLDLHFVLASQRLQDLNTKIRGRTRLLLGHVSLDDYELKVRRLLRNSKYKTDILKFRRGEFLNAENDAVIQFPRFHAKGKPYQWTQKPKTETEKPCEPPCYPVKPKKKSRFRSWLKVLKTLFFVDYGDLKQPNHKAKRSQPEDQSEETEEDQLTEEETDFRMYG